MNIQIPALKKPTLSELQKKYPWISSIEKDESTEVPVTLSLKKYVDDGVITGSKLEKQSKGSQLGFQHMMWIVENQDKFPELMAQAKKEKFWYLLFPAMVVVRRGGVRCVPYCGRDGSRWDDYWDWLDNGFDSYGRIAFGQVAGTQKLAPSHLDTESLSALEKRIKALEDWKEIVQTHHA